MKNLSFTSKVIVLVVIMTIALLIGLSGSALAQEESKLPPATPSDHRMTTVELVSSDGKNDHATPIRESDFLLRGGVGYFTDSENHGLGGFFEFNKTFSFGWEGYSHEGNDLAIGFRLDPGANIQTRVNLNKDPDLNYGDFNLSVLSGVGVRYRGRDRTVTYDFAFASAGLRYYNGPVYWFGGAQLRPIKMHWHIGLPRQWELMVGFSVPDLTIGKGKTKDQEFDLMMGAALFFGIGWGMPDFIRLRAIADYWVHEAMAGKDWEDETVTSKSVAPFTHNLLAKLEMDQLGGSPAGLFYHYNLLYSGHSNWLAPRYNAESLTHNHVAGLMLTY